MRLIKGAAFLVLAMVMSARVASAVGDVDGDGVPDAQDNCVAVFNPSQVDMDGDHVGDACDNCRAVANGGQVDTNGDGFGNRCDCDFNSDNFCGGPDFTLFIGCFNSSIGTSSVCAAADMNGDGFVGGPDFTLFIGGFNGQPGPGASGAETPPVVMVPTTGSYAITLGRLITEDCLTLGHPDPASGSGYLLSLAPTYGQALVEIYFSDRVDQAIATVFDFNYVQGIAANWPDPLDPFAMDTNLTDPIPTSVLFNPANPDRLILTIDDIFEVDDGDRLEATVTDGSGARWTDDICLADAIPPILDSFACTEDTTGGTDDTCTAVFSEPVDEWSVKNLWDGWGGGVIDSGVLARAIDPSVDPSLAVEVSADRRTVTVHVDDLSKVDPTTSNNTVTIDGVRDDYGNAAQDNGRFDVQNFHLSQWGVNGVTTDNFRHTAFGTGWGANDHQAAGLVDVFGPRLSNADFDRDPRVVASVCAGSGNDIYAHDWDLGCDSWWGDSSTITLHLTSGDAFDEFPPPAVRQAKDIENPSNWSVEGLQQSKGWDFSTLADNKPMFGWVGNVSWEPLTKTLTFDLEGTLDVANGFVRWRIISGTRIIMNTSIEDKNGNPVTIHNTYTYHAAVDATDTSIWNRN